MSNSEHPIRWRMPGSDDVAAQKLASEAGVSRLVAQLLLNRGVTDRTEAQAFLTPSLGGLHDPGLLPGMDAGTERVARAIEAKERICVHGDYDVDGVTSAALLVRTLAALGADVTYRIPHRRRDGYGINVATVEELASQGANLIITCDCGVTAVEPVQRANELGVDVVITDHHEQLGRLPDAVAVIDPKIEGSQYPFPYLAGVGVAFKFGQALVRRLGHNEASFQSKFVDLAAIGTVGDVVPLLGENRALVHTGLKALPESKKVGIRSMVQFAGMAEKQITAYHLGYVFGPRINAVGRMDDAVIALQLLITKEESEAQTILVEMERLNLARRAVQERVLGEAKAQCELIDLVSRRILVLHGEDWDVGVIGIVAGKIREQLSRPTIMIARDEANGVGHGSARSIEAFDMFEALNICSDLLIRHGGHALAAGLKISLDCLDEFEERINELGQETITDDDLIPTIDVEAEISLDEVTEQMAQEVAQFEPFGNGNPEPTFALRGVRIVDKQLVGDGSHLKLMVGQNGSRTIGCIGFGLAHYASSLTIGGSADLCGAIRINEYNGRRTAQLNLLDIIPQV